MRPDKSCLSLKLYLIASLLFYSILHMEGQILPEDRAVNWRIAGFKGEIPAPALQLNILDFGGQVDGITDNSTAFQNTINALDGNPGVVFFPPGNYYFSTPIHLTNGVVLRGEHSDNTILTFDLGGANDLIQIQGTATSVIAPLITNASKGDKKISVSNTNGFAVGDYIRIAQEDFDLVTSSWALGTIGQIVQIKKVIGNKILLDSRLRRDFLLANHPIIRKLEMVEQTGIECLKIVRLDETNPIHTSTIKYQYAAQSWISGVESENCNFAHVTIDASTNITVTGCYFHHAFDYGGGGRAYGVMIQQTGNECKIENNVFEHLRHSMIVQSGANGNVFGYNYSFDPFWSTTNFPDSSAGDIVCHGNYPYANLFEGNIAQQIVIDNSHGSNGPFNTFFRNRAELYGIFMSAGNSPAQNFIGNEITNGPDDNLGLYFLLGDHHLEYGNNIRGDIKPDVISLLSEGSYYKEELFYPAVGIPNPINTGVNNAMARVTEAANFTLCLIPGGNIDKDTLFDQQDQYIEIDHNFLVPDSNISKELKVYPNPVKGDVFLRLTTAQVQFIEVKIFSSLGVLVYHKNLLNFPYEPLHISLKGFTNGMYWIIIKEEGGERFSKKIIVNDVLDNH